MRYLIIAILIQILFDLYVIKKLKTNDKLLDIIHIRIENIKAYLYKEKQPFDTLEKASQFLNRKSWRTKWEKLKHTLLARKN